MKIKFKSLILALLSSASFFALADGTVVFKPAIIGPSMVSVKLTNVVATGYFSTKGCALTDNATSVTCYNVNPQAIQPGALKVNFIFENSGSPAPSTPIEINKGSGDSLSNSSFMVGYMHVGGTGIICNVDNGSGSIQSGLWTVPFVCRVYNPIPPAAS